MAASSTLRKPKPHIIALISSDRKTYKFEAGPDDGPLESLKIKLMIEDNCPHTSIPTGFNSKALAKVIEYCKRLVEASKSSEGDKSSDEDLKSFVADLGEVDLRTLVDVQSAGLYLGIQSLVGLATQAVANRRRGGTPVSNRQRVARLRALMRRRVAKLRELKRRRD